MALCRARAELHEDVASFLADSPDVVVGVDRRGVEKAPRGYLDPMLPPIVA